MERYLKKQITYDLKKKMVFLGGPRQVGKTTLSKKISTKNYAYLNWDIDEDRENILKKNLPDKKLWIFDEIHKYKKWRNYLKGLYDAFHEDRQILVTGSARLDYYRYSGDSLQGRYHYLRLHPLSVAELKIESVKDFMELLELGAFPEQFFIGSKTQSARWSREYRSRLINEEIGSIEQISDIGSLELLMLRLPELVGSPLSINALREDLQLAFKTVARWLDILERFYAIFRLSPFGHPKIKAVKKEQKHYHFDWTLVQDLPGRFENIIAMHLLKWVHYEQDTKGRELDLMYFRDQERREVDFVITENRKPITAIECKWNDADISPHLKYFKNKFPEVSAIQVSAVGVKDYISGEKIRGLPAVKYLRTLI
jgi:uncharacterized protein